MSFELPSISRKTGAGSSTPVALASLSKLIFTFVASGLLALSQQPQQPVGQPGAQQPVQPAPPATTAPSSAPQGNVTTTTPPPEEPKVLEDGGFSIEPMYWLTRAAPALYGGLQSSQSEIYASLNYPGKSDPGYGGEVAIPTGHSNTLRISVFRVLGNSNNTLTQSPTIFGEAYTAGDYLESHYNIQSAKISWDYLSYTWRRKPGNIHLKTLYEMQYVNIGTSINAPFLPVTTDSSGNIDDNSTSGSKSIFLPTFGMELEQAIGHHFRWEVKASGMGLPHHSDIGDVQADIAIRISKFELIGGEKYYHFKTGPGGDQYFSDTLNGAFVAIRYYIGMPHR